MSQNHFDLAAMAVYLHLTPEKVRRMADRGVLPGRKVGGEWQFSEADVHHWLEDRIGASDDDELVEVEGVLDRATPAPSVSIEQLIPENGISAMLPARSRQSVINKMCQLGMNTGLLWDPNRMEQAIKARESLHPTALDNGVALLHPRRPMPGILAEGFILLGRTPQGIPFGGGCLTDLFFMLCSVNDGEHLKVLTRLSRLLTIDACVDALRDADDEDAMRDVLKSYGESLEPDA